MIHVSYYDYLFTHSLNCLSDGATECGAITSNGYPITSKGISVKLGPLKALNLNGDVNSNDIGAIGEILVCSPNMSSGNLMFHFNFFFINLYI